MDVFVPVEKFEKLKDDLAVARAALEKLAEWEDIDSAALIRVRLFAKEALQRINEPGVGEASPMDGEERK